MTLAVGSSARLQEEVIEGQVVSDGVPPALASVSEVGEVVQNILVDVGQHQLLVGAAEDGHGDQSNVGMLGLGLVRERDSEQPGVQLGHGEHCQVSRGTEPLVYHGQAGGGVRGLQEWGQRLERGVVEVGQRCKQPHPVCQCKVVELGEVE